LLLIAIGAVTIIFGLITDHKSAWANYLVVNYYFLSVAMGGAFFFVIQSISQSGWSSAFQRVSEAMMSYVPVAAVSFLLLWFGMNDLYHWSHNQTMAVDPLLQHKSPFLNVPFFFARMVLYFGLWIIFIRILRKISLRSDLADPADSNGIMLLFGKTELYSKIFIFIIAVTFSFSAIDWIMSIDYRWYSTIYIRTLQDEETKKSELKEAGSR